MRSQDLPLIVVIDDTVAADTADSYCRDDFLKDMGEDLARFRFCTAYDDFDDDYLADVALEFVDGLEEMPAAALIDVMFGRADKAKELGFEIMALLRQSKPRLAIIAMSSESADSPVGEAARHQTLFERAQSRGADDFVRKPINKDELKQKLELALARRRPPPKTRR